MTPPTSSPAHVLAAEMVEHAARESGRILESARSDAAAWLASARAQAEQEREHRLRQTRDDAARLTARLLATLPLEERRRRADRVESLLQALRERIHRQLHLKAESHPRETALRLAAQSIQAMEGTAFRIRGSPASGLEPESVLSAELARATARRGLSVQCVADPALTPGSVIVEDLPGRQRTDNRLASRLDRLWPELRRQIAQVPDLFLQPPTAPESS